MTDGARITVEVALAPAILDKASPGDTLFVPRARAERTANAVGRRQASGQRTATDGHPDRRDGHDAGDEAVVLLPGQRSAQRSRRVDRRALQAGDLVASDVVVDSADPPHSVQLLIDRVVE